MSHLICPSILAADFLQLGKAIELINESEADWVHCDIMDGTFVPNISFGLPVVRAIKRIATKPLDVHLMIQRPEEYVEAFRDAGADHFTVHIEACLHLDRTLRLIREKGMMAGVALNPATPVDGLKHVLPLADIVLVMTVNPGFGGQKFIPYTLEKVRALRHMIDAAGTATSIQVDGGVDDETAPRLLTAGADALVAGNHVFGSADPLAAIRLLKSIDVRKYFA
jgi:ribulose-phosphate 3-epimerase